MKIKRNQKGQWDRGNNSGQRFYPGMTPHNKGVHEPTSPKSAATYFAKGHLPASANPEGTVTVWKDKSGLLYEVINIDPFTGKRKSQYNYGKYVLEQHLGRYLNKGEIVYHLNGQSNDNRLENLRIVSRAELLRLNRQS